MKTLITAPNIISTLTVRKRIFDDALNRLEIAYRVSRSTIEPVTAVGFNDRSVFVHNIPATYDDEGTETVPANNVYSDFIAQIDSNQNILDFALQKAEEDAIAKGLFTEYDETVIWDEAETPSVGDAIGWTENVLVGAGMVRKLDGIRYRAKYTHLTNTGDYYPPNLTVWNEIEETGTGFDVWVQPQGAHDAYEVGAIVHFPTLEDPLYINTSPNNVYNPLTFGWDLYTR